MNRHRAAFTDKLLKYILNEYALQKKRRQNESGLGLSEVFEYTNKNPKNLYCEHSSCRDTF